MAGNTTPATTVLAQITNGAISQAEIPVILRPPENMFAITSAASVVTSAIPPRSAGIYLIDSFKINGASIICAKLKII